MTQHSAHSLAIHGDSTIFYFNDFSVQPITDSYLKNISNILVVFPHPEGPIIAVTLFSLKFRETSDRMFLLPNAIDSESTFILSDNLSSLFAN